MIFVIQKKFKLKKTEKQRESLKFCNVIKTEFQEAYEQGFSKCIKSDTNRSQQKIFSNKSVIKFSRNIKRFFQMNPLKSFPELSTLFSKIICQRFFLNAQHFFKNKFVFKFSRNIKRFFLEYPFSIFSETSKDFFQNVRCEFFLKCKTVFKIKSFVNSDFIEERFFLKNSLSNFLELSMDLFEKIFCYNLKLSNFHNFKSLYSCVFQKLSFIKYLNLMISFVFLSFFSSKMNLSAKCY